MAMVWYAWLYGYTHTMKAYCTCISSGLTAWQASQNYSRISTEPIDPSSPRALRNLNPALKSMHIKMRRTCITAHTYPNISFEPMVIIDWCRNNAITNSRREANETKSQSKMIMHTKIDSCMLRRVAHITGPIPKC